MDTVESKIEAQATSLAVYRNKQFTAHRMKFSDVFRNSDTLRLNPLHPRELRHARLQGKATSLLRLQCENRYVRVRLDLHETSNRFAVYRNSLPARPNSLHPRELRLLNPRQHERARTDGQGDTGHPSQAKLQGKAAPPLRLENHL